jgi:N6-adenosine-specific RNA methylase IME4
VQQIAQTPVQPFADRDCHLWLWVINRYVPDAYDVARAWGFEPSTLLTWAKRPMGGGLGGTFGISTEHILFATRGRVDARARVTGTSFDWKRPYVNGKPAHSRKPPEFFAMAERVSHAERLELFARAPRPHWRVWGNEVESDIQIEVPKP